MTERYEIHLKGHLDPEWFGDLNHLSFSHTENGETIMLGDLPDQTALHGLLARIRDLGVPILMVAQRNDDVNDESDNHILHKEYVKMKNPWIAAVLNFFFMGPGTLYVGRRKALGAALTVGAIVLTYVELQLQTAAPALYPIMFGAVFLMNLFFAIDGYQEAKSVNGQ